ncbi:DUF4349 domain-containing protein [Chloroflexota bacterium]
MKKLIIIIGLLTVVSLLLFAACSPAIGEKQYSIDDGSGAPGSPIWDVTEESRPEMAMPTPPPVVVNTGKPGSDLNLQSDPDRMIVRRGDIALVVEDVPITIDRITVMADSYDGYIVNSRVWKERERLIGSIAIRVPAEHFDDTMRMLREIAVDITSESSTSQDVTEEYVDLSAMLENLEATEAQLFSVMQKAETVEDILNVQRELSRVRGEIERAKARMQYLERTSATSLIQIQLVQSKLSIEFQAQSTRITLREEVRFFPNITGGFSPYSYEWDFGDGATSTEDNPTYTYKKAGNYTVSLTVSDDRGNIDSKTRPNYITVLPGWNPGNIVSSAWNGLATFGQVITNILIWLGIFSPVWITIGGISYGIYYWIRRKKKTETK